jgi:predicted DNA-binding transcriptional regulator AlpA
MKDKKMKIEDGRKTLAMRDDLKRLGIKVSNTTLLRWEARGRFPRRIRMAGTSVAWFVCEVDEWLVERAAERARTRYTEY